MHSEAESTRRFWRISAAGVFFQGGAAAVDTSTIVAALVHGLTGSALAVGAAAAIARYGWLFPQLIIGWLAQRRRHEARGTLICDLRDRRAPKLRANSRLTHS